MNATHEPIPGAETGQHDLLGALTKARRDAWANDPRSTWALDDGRDAIYAGLNLPNTGVSARVMRTEPMQGLYTPKGLPTETNLGFNARPLVTFKTGAKGGTKEITDHDRLMVNQAETLRAAVDVQNYGGAHINWANGRARDSNSLFMPLNRKATEQELLSVKKIGEQHGLPDPVDTGRGITLTNFSGTPEIKAKQMGQLLAQLGENLPAAEVAHRVKVDAMGASLQDEWNKGVQGSGRVAKNVSDALSVTPRTRQMWNDHPLLADKVMGKVMQSKDWAKEGGVERQDVENFRRIVGSGKGWLDRLDAARKSGVILPAFAAAVGAALLSEQKSNPDGT